MKSNIICNSIKIHSITTHSSGHPEKYNTFCMSVKTAQMIKSKIYYAHFNLGVHAYSKIEPCWLYRVHYKEEKSIISIDKCKTYNIITNLTL